MLVAFRRGDGFVIDQYTLDATCEFTEKGKGSFRDRLKRLIVSMLGEGVEPRFVKDVDGVYWVFYE
jgi:hypothetical protein